MPNERLMSMNRETSRCPKSPVEKRRDDQQEPRARGDHFAEPDAGGIEIRRGCQVSLQSVRGRARRDSTSAFGVYTAPPWVILRAWSTQPPRSRPSPPSKPAY